MAIDPLALARDLIDIPSCTGEERELAGFVSNLLEREGFSCERQAVTGDRFNLFASAGGTPRVVLCTHLDTVPPFFGSREDENNVYGRGACDTKGILAAMITAAVGLRNEGCAELALLFVIGEETDSIGAKMANAHFSGRGIEYTVVGEPTESNFVRASKGALTATVRFHGRAAHSAYPELGDSAILKLVRAVMEIDGTLWGEHPVLGKATSNIGVVRGGRKANVVPEDAELEVIIRTTGSDESVRKRLAEIVRAFDGKVISSHGNPPTFMAVPSGEEAVVVAFNTDVPHLHLLGTPLLFGPGSILDAHGENEKIGKRELVAAVGRYRELVTSLLTGKEVHRDATDT